MKNLVAQYKKFCIYNVGFEEIKLDIKTFERWGCFECKFFPICGSRCPWDFVKNKRCTEWKSMLEYRLLNQYKLFLKEPEIFDKTPFNISKHFK